LNTKSRGSNLLFRSILIILLMDAFVLKFFLIAIAKLRTNPVYFLVIPRALVYQPQKDHQIHLEIR